MCICICCAEWMDGHGCVVIWRLRGHRFIQSSFIFVIIPLSVSQAWVLRSQSLCVFIYILVKFSLVMPVSQSPIHSKNTSRSRVCFARTITEIFLCSIQHAIIASSGAIQRASNQTFEHIYIGLDFLVNFILVCIHCLFITSFAFRRCSACLSNLLTST